MWGQVDAFHYAYKQVSGDLVLKTKVEWPDKEGNMHKKAGWMVRQSLDADAAYVDAVVHCGDGLVSMQYRLQKGGPTLEVKSPIPAPVEIMLERHGDVFTLSVARPDQAFQIVGSVQLVFADPLFAGLAVCSHDSNRVETAIFSQVEMETPGVFTDKERAVTSYLEIIDIQTKERHIVYSTRDHIEAPNWSRDGAELLFNSQGKLYTIPAAGGVPELVPSGAAVQCNNDHGYSLDGKWLAVSSQHADNTSLIYILPATGGEARLVTPVGPSYWHGWSPDGKTLAYCAARNNEYDIYTIPVQGGREKRLTDAKGLDDGPDYTFDGTYIYFNSERTGLMKIWRMKSDGSGQEQVTTDPDFADWFAHPSPDGQWNVFVSFDKSVQGHPANKLVALRLMPLKGGEPQILAWLFGGQGTINVPSWNPESNKVAFVSYKLVGSK
jgi:TolB protein